MLANWHVCWFMQVKFRIKNHITGYWSICFKTSFLLQKRGKVAPLIQKIVSIATNSNNRQVERIMKARMGLFRHECYKAAVEHLADSCPQLELRQVSLSYIQFLPTVFKINPTDQVKHFILTCLCWICQRSVISDIRFIFFQIKNIFDFFAFAEIKLNFISLTTKCFCWKFYHTHRKEYLKSQFKMKLT